MKKYFVVLLCLSLSAFGVIGPFPGLNGGGGGGSGTVTSVSVVSANGLAGSVANATTTPAITLRTSITGLLQGNGTAISAATVGNLTDAGTDGITVTSGTGAVIGSGTSLSQHVADSTHNGYLSFTDWLTFNGKQSALTIGNLTDAGTDGITVTSGTGAVIGSGTSISQHVADSTHNGYLSSTDWSTFNGKQSTALTSAHILVGNVSNVATDVAMSGDISISNAGLTSYAGTVPISKGGTNSTAALNNNRVMQSSGGAIVEAAAITGSRALASDSNGIPVASATTATELGYVSGVTSAIQTQISAKAPIASPAFTGQITFGNYHLEPSEYDSGNSGSTKTLDWTNGSAQKSTLTASVTYTLTNPATGGTYVLKIIQGASSYTVTWPSNVKWAGGTAPVISTTNGHLDLISLYYDGTDYFGTFSQNYTP